MFDFLSLSKNLYFSNKLVQKYHNFGLTMLAGAQFYFSFCPLKNKSFVFEINLAFKYESKFNSGSARQIKKVKNNNEN